MMTGKRERVWERERECGDGGDVLAQPEVEKRRGHPITRVVSFSSRSSSEGKIERQKDKELRRDLSSRTGRGRGAPGLSRQTREHPQSTLHFPSGALAVASLFVLSLFPFPYLARAHRDVGAAGSSSMSALLVARLTRAPRPSRCRPLSAAREACAGTIRHGTRGPREPPDRQRQRRAPRFATAFL